MLGRVYETPETADHNGCEHQQPCGYSDSYTH